jgi:predicted transcriptional regulator
MSDETVNLHIGSLQEMGDRFVAAWKAAELGAPVSRDNITFLSLETFVSALSPRRLELIRYLRSEGPMSVRKLAGELSRDYKSVHSDVALLATAGLVIRESNERISVPWDHVQADMRLAA